MYKAGMSEDCLADFIDSARAALTEGRFVRIVLSGYRGAEKDLKKIAVREIAVKSGIKLSFTYSYKTRDIVKNYDIEEALQKVAALLQKDVASAVLLTTGFDLSYPAMKKAKPSITQKPQTDHDRAKVRHVETKGRHYLAALGITDDTGAVLKSAQDKYKQIDRYIDILSSHLKNFSKDTPVRIVDMGSGKGYLTFALYDYMASQGWDAHVTGVEIREDLVALCNGIAAKSRFKNLSFEKGSVDDFSGAADILIALHACDTATDDAIAKGIEARARLIVVAPCCHKQIRREMEGAKTENDLDFLTKYGVFAERQAEMVTDGLRALVLQYFGYGTSVLEFISDAHTPKNVMIVATRAGVGDASKDKKILEKIKAVKSYFGIGSHHLEKKLSL